VQLLGEKVNAEVSVLTGRFASRDADDLARTALEDQQIPKSDVVAGDGDSVGGVARRRSAVAATAAATSTTCGDLNVNFFATTHLLSNLVETVAERVIVSCDTTLASCREFDLEGEEEYTVFVVISHVLLRELGGRIDSSVDANFFLVSWLETRSVASFCNVNCGV
jgi:hypothetical protein